MSNVEDKIITCNTLRSSLVTMTFLAAEEHFAKEPSYLPS